MNELKSIQDLVEAPYNPRVISDRALDGLKESLGEFGDISGIVWNEVTGHLVCGHQRFRALKDRYGDKLGFTPRTGFDGPYLFVGSAEDMVTFPIRVVDWPIEKEKAANLAGNHPSIQGDWDDGLRDVVREVKDTLPEVFNRLQFVDLEILAVPPPLPPELDESLAEGIAVCRCPDCGHEHHKEEEKGR